MNSTNSGRRWVRTTGPSPVRRSFTVAGHRLTSPITAANCTDRRRSSTYIAGSLALFAPRLAPGISLALLIKTNVAGLLSGTRAKVAPAELEASGRQVDEISWCPSPCRRGGNPEPDRATRRGQGRRRPTGRTERPGYLSKCTDVSIHHSTVSSRSLRISEDPIRTLLASGPYVGRLEFGGKDRLGRIQNGGSLYTCPLACALGFLSAPTRRQSGRDFTGGRESREVSLCAKRFYYVTIVGRCGVICR